MTKIKFLLIMLMGILSINSVYSSTPPNNVEKGITLTVGQSITLDPRMDIGKTNHIVSAGILIQDDQGYSVGVQKHYLAPTSLHPECYYETYKITAKKVGTYTFRAFVFYDVPYNPMDPGWSLSVWATYTITIVDVESITIPSQKVLTVGEEYTFEPIINDPKATTILSWESSNERVATVTDGTVKAISAGTTLITCTAHNGVSASCQLTVEALAELEVGTQFAQDDIIYEVLPNKELLVCGGGSGDIEIPEVVTVDGVIYRVTAIKAFAYSNSSITGLVLPNSIEFIPNSGFEWCQNLKSVKFGENLIEIGCNAFYNCRSLKEISLPNSIKHIGRSAFGDTGLTELYIPESVVSLDFGFCYGTKDLKAIDVSSLNQYYTSVDGVLFSKDMKDLISYPINKYSPEYEIPVGVIKICQAAFSDIRSTSVVITPESLRRIEESAFYQSQINEIRLNEGLEYIGEDAFYNSHNKKITIPQSVNSIGPGAFVSWNLKEINVNPENPMYCDVDGVLFDKNLTTLYCFPSQKETTEYKLPSTVEIILSKAIHRNSYLKNIVLPDGLKTIGEFGISICKQLNTVNIPSSVKYIGNTAFWVDEKLMSIYVENPTPNTIEYGEDIFEGVDRDNCIIYVPANSVDLYKQTFPWSEFSNIKPIVLNGKCEAPTISLVDNALQVRSNVEDAVCHVQITSDDFNTFEVTSGEDIVLTGQYKVKCYATADGYDTSDIVEATIIWANPTLGSLTTLEDNLYTPARKLLIQDINGSIRISGVESGETVMIYTIDGMMVYNEMATDSSVVVHSNLQKGKVYIIKCGNRSAKYIHR